MGSYIVDDIIITEDVFLKKKKYFLSSESRGKYIRLTGNQYSVFSRIIPIMLSTDDESEIAERFRLETGQEIEIEKIGSVFKKHNLLYESCQERKGTVEAEFTSNKLCEIKLGKLQEKAGTVFSIMWWLLAVTFILLLAAVAAIGYMRFSAGEELIRLRRMDSFSAFMNLDPLILASGLIMCIVGHEAGHLLTAHHTGIKWKSITVALKWGISAMYYVKYRNFYNNSSVNKLAVILSGAAMNLYMSMVWLLLDWYTPHIEFEIIMFVNLFGILKNLLPKGTSDGYHAFCIAAGIEGVRWKMLKSISLILNKPKDICSVLSSNENKVLFLYFILSYTVSISGFYKIIMNMVGTVTANDNITVKIFLIVGITLLIIFGFVRNIIKLFKSIKRM